MDVRHLRWLLIGAGAGALLIFGLLRLGVLLPSPADSPSRVFNPSAVLVQIQALRQLVTVKHSIQKVIALEERKVPFGAERILLFVQAEVAAGIDLAEMDENDIKVVEPGVLAISLPAARITSISIDEDNTKVWDRSITWWTPWVPYNQDLERQARVAARQDVEKAALDMGILEQAETNAETAIRQLLTATGVNEVRFLRAD